VASIKINNADFYYELHGEGHPLVLIAGYNCDHSFWLPLLDKLCKNFQVLIFDNRAVGRTIDENIPLTAELLAHDVISLADQLNLKNPHIVGHSMGGSIAQLVAVLYPEKINKLGILCSTAKWREAVLLCMRSSLAMREKNIDMNLILDSVVPWIFGNEFLKKADNIALFKQMTLQNPYFQTLNNQMRQYYLLQQLDVRDLINKIQTPTLVAYGTEDILALPYESQYLSKTIPNAQLMEFECAHGVVFEVTDKIANALVNFLN